MHENSAQRGEKKLIKRSKNKNEKLGELDIMIFAKLDNFC